MIRRSIAAQFSGEYALSIMDEPVYEYACHEGNYGLMGILAGARRLEVLGEENNERTDGSDRAVAKLSP